MFSPLFANHIDLWGVDLWYAVPLIVAVSLVYAATRHEQIGPILRHATRVAVWIAGFMLVVFAVIQSVSWLISA
jgi:hypothetical protein